MSTVAAVTVAIKFNETKIKMPDNFNPCMFESWSGFRATFWQYLPNLYAPKASVATIKPAPIWSARFCDCVNWRWGDVLVGTALTDPLNLTSAIASPRTAIPAAIQILRSWLCDGRIIDTSKHSGFIRGGAKCQAIRRRWVGLVGCSKTDSEKNDSRFLDGTIVITRTVR